jgi:hypothetical protein
MPFYDIHVTGSYKCKNAKGQFTKSQAFDRTITVEMNSPDDDAGLQIFSQLDQDAPDNCVSTSYSRGASIPAAYDPYGPPPGESPTGDTGVDTTPGQIITFYGLARYVFPGGGDDCYRTVRVDESSTSTVAVVMAALQAAAEAIGIEGDSCSGGVYDSVQLIAPAYYQYS